MEQAGDRKDKTGLTGVVGECRFLEGDLHDSVANQKRHSMLKLIPSVPQGSWIIKQTVGSTPVLLGTKIATTYHRFVLLVLPPVASSYAGTKDAADSGLAEVIWCKLGCTPSCLLLHQATQAPRYP